MCLTPMNLTGVPYDPAEAYIDLYQTNHLEILLWGLKNFE